MSHMKFQNAHADLICSACGQSKTVTASTSQATLISTTIELRQENLALIGKAAGLEAEIAEKLERINALVKVREALIAENARMQALLGFREKGTENA